MILCEENLEDFNAPLLEKIAQSLTNKDVELVLVDSAKMREINKIHRGIDKSTDVLSFPLVNPLDFASNFGENLAEFNEKSSKNLTKNSSLNLSENLTEFDEKSSKNLTKNSSLNLSENFAENSNRTNLSNLKSEEIPEISLLGSIVINLDAINSGAKEFHHSKSEEFALLFIHALLHLLGFDHENDKGIMREKEAQIIAKFKLPKSLIVRNLG